MMTDFMADLAYSTSDMDVAGRIIDGGDPALLERLARNGNLTPAAMRRLLDRCNEICHVSWNAKELFGSAYQIYVGLADNRGADADILRKLSKCGESRVRFFVAMNPNAGGRLLAELAGDLDGGVRQAVARNTSCPVSVLKSLAEHDADKYVRAYAMVNLENRTRERGEP